MALSYLLLVLCFGLTIAADPQPDFVVEMFRHGARGPLQNYYDPNKIWEGQYGELTPLGMRMHYVLGATVASQYSNLLGKYDPNKILIRSTDSHRTIMSAYSHMYGIYNQSGPAIPSNVSPNTAVPPFKSKVIADTINKMNNAYALPDNFQVVPVHVVPVPNDIQLRPFDNCPMQSKWALKLGNDDESNRVFRVDLKKATDYLKSQGVKISSFLDLFYVGDTSIANEFQNVALPGGISIDGQNPYYHDVKFAADWYTVKTFEGEATQRAVLALNPFQIVTDYINSFLNGTTQLSYVVLSAHDTTLLTILSALEIVTTDCLYKNYQDQKAGKAADPTLSNCEYPPFAANIIFEVYKTANPTDPYVIFKYNNVPINLCNNPNNQCSMSDLTKLISKVTNSYTLDDFNRICEVKTTTLIAKDKKDSNLNTLYALIAVCIVLAISFFVTCFKLRATHDKLRDDESNPNLMEV